MSTRHVTSADKSRGDRPRTAAPRKEPWRPQPRKRPASPRTAASPTAARPDVSPKLPPPSLVSAPDATAREIADARGTYYDHAVGFTPLLAVDTVAGLFLLDTHDAHMGRSLFSKSSRGELRVLRRALRILEDAGLAERARAGTFIDVGANIGTTTVPALYANGFTRALGLEPEPRNIHMLRINIAINGFTDQVQVLQVAASNTCGTGHLRVFPDRWGIHEIAAENGAESGSEEKVVEIELVTLDSLAEQSLYDADGTGLLWIDAEGHEGHILHGATRLVSEGTPVILEVQPSKLQGQGGLEFLRDAAEGHYTDFVDMRHVSGEPTSPRGVKYEIKPIDHFQALIDEYLELDHFTEALLLRR